MKFQNLLSVWAARKPIVICGGLVVGRMPLHEVFVASLDDSCR